MINVTVGEHKPQNKKSFPKLMKSVNTGNVVFFMKEGNGTVILLGENNTDIFELGEHTVGYTMYYFTDFNESITLQNQ